MRVMALPTEESLSVRGEIDLGRVLSRGFFPMTLATELARSRLRRLYGPGSHPVLRRHLVTRRTTDQGMGGDGLDARDLRVAGRALPRNLGRYRIMGVVTGGAGLERIMQRRIDLRKSSRPRRIVGVAADAEIPPLRHERFSRHVLYMRLHGPMTGFARESFVVTVLFLAGLLTMAVSADGAARKYDLLCNFPLDGGFLVKSPVY